MPTCKRLATVWRIVREPLIAAVFTALYARPVLAQSTNPDCTVPREFQPLMGMLDSLTQLAFLGGIGLATLGFTVAGIFIILPGQDNARKGKIVAKNVLIGTIILLSAHMVVSFLRNQLGNGVFC